MFASVPLPAFADAEEDSFTETVLPVFSGQENNEEITEISEWVEAMRVELKKKVVIKQQKLKRNQNFYTYMHDIFGADVINIFDMKYNPEENKLHKKE